MIQHEGASTLPVRDKALEETSPVIRNTVELQQHLRLLAALPESEAPTVSCYLDLESARTRWQSVLDRRLRLLRQTAPDADGELLEGAMDRIRSFLADELRPEARGFAAFSRDGAEPYFTALQFEAPTPTSISLDTVPNIYHLIELKDDFDRYLVLLCTSDSARIFEVHLGAVSRELLLRQPELRRRIGREWTRLHYQNHRRDRDRTFLREKTEALERLVRDKGYTRIILAGDPQRVAMVRHELPREIRERVIDSVALPRGLDEKEVVRATLASFIEEEEREGRSLSELLVSELRRDGLAVPGAGNCLQVLRRGQADALVLAKEWESSRAWSCGECTWSAAGDVTPELCAECGAQELREHDAREELVRLAEQTGCEVEIVGESKPLLELGGAGCLLRFDEWINQPGD